VTIPRDQWGSNPCLCEGDNISHTDTIGPRRPLHNIHPCYRIWATFTCGAAIVGWLRDDVKPFCIDKIHIDGPNRVEDQPDLGKIETFECISSKHEVPFIKNKAAPRSPCPGVVGFVRRLEARKLNLILRGIKE
jgi:hypothetical protein